MSPAISVIITCYNLDRYIGAAIESVLAQDLESPVEIIVVDDCSNDGSAAIIKSFPQVRYIRTDVNAGVLLATLKGLEAAHGDIIFFLDGDDVWKPRKLSACIAAFASEPHCALTTHDVDFMDGDGQPLRKTSRPREVLDSLPVADCSAAIIKGILHSDSYVWLGSALGVRRSLARLDDFRDWAKTLPDPANTYQDWPLAFWIASLPQIRAAYVPEVLFQYRLHRANYSGDARTPARAARNFMRARNTLDAMARLAVERQLPGSVQRLLHGRARANDYLVSLYHGRRINALAAFPGAAPDFLRQGRLSKELIRLCAVLLVGPARFSAWSARRSAG